MTNTGVYKVMKTRDVIEIPAKGQTITAFEGDFQRPTRDDSLFGKSYPVDFKNKTGLNSDKYIRTGYIFSMNRRENCDCIREI